jgi:hypothetical protein
MNMSVLDHVRLVVYRFHERGLEILVPEAKSCLIDTDSLMVDNDRTDAIELNSMIDQNGLPIRIMALEGDWHDIPSIRGLIKSDLDLVKGKIKEIVPELENCVYVAIKEAFKEALPHEYAALKELKDVLMDRNIILNL